MSVRKPSCECCGRVRKGFAAVTKCGRCRKYVCAEAYCIPHDAGACGDSLRNFSERRKAVGDVECSRNATKRCAMRPVARHELALSLHFG
jgi:hypothetical protein